MILNATVIIDVVILRFRIYSPTLSVERAVLASRNIQSVASVQSLPKALQLVVPIVLVFYGSVHL